MDSPEHERREIVDYLGGQAPDETVDHAEKISEERVFGRDYKVWDVHTDKNRWWVITSPTNLYRQSDFKSLDNLISFHIGLTMRVLAKDNRTADDASGPRLGRARRQWEQAAEADNVANEAEDFQAVGMKCRETLVSLAHALASSDLVPQGAEAPKASDFIHWAELFVNAAAPGPSGARLRSYLKTLAKQTWDYVAWVTHAKNAVRFDSANAVEVTGYLLAMFEAVMMRAESDAPDRCPACESYRIATTSYLSDDDFVHLRICEACDWQEAFTPRRLSAPPPEVREPEGDCLTPPEL